MGTMTSAIYLTSYFFLVMGGIFCIIGGIGLLRMPDFFTRLHAASVIETLRAGFLLVGMMLQAGLSLITVKLIFIFLLIFFTSPTATHALARAAKFKKIDQQNLHDEEGANN